MDHKEKLCEKKYEREVDSDNDSPFGPRMRAEDRSFPKSGSTYPQKSPTPSPGNSSSAGAENSPIQFKELSSPGSYGFKSKNFDLIDTDTSPVGVLLMQPKDIWTTNRTSDEVSKVDRGKQPISPIDIPVLNTSEYLRSGNIT